MSSGQANETANSPAYRQAVALVKQDAAQPDWSTFGVSAGYAATAKSLSFSSRKTYAALLLAYAQQLQNAHQLPDGATSQLTADFTKTTPELAVFLHGNGATLQTVFLNSASFRLTFGHQMGCLGQQGLARKYAGPAGLSQKCPS